MPLVINTKNESFDKKERKKWKSYQKDVSRKVHCGINKEVTTWWSDRGDEGGCGDDVMVVVDGAMVDDDEGFRVKTIVGKRKWWGMVVKVWSKTWWENENKK